MFGRKTHMPETSPGSINPPSTTQNWQAQASQPAPSEQPSAQVLSASQSSPRKAPTSAPTSIIGDNFTMEGDNITIRCQGSLQVDGNLNAELHCQELTVGQAGRVSGAIAADDVRVHGTVSGTINGTHVTLYATSEVEGDINSQYLAIERGARFDGRSRRVDNAEEVAPQLQSGGVSHQPAAAAVTPLAGQPAQATTSDDTVVPGTPWNAA